MKNRALSHLLLSLLLLTSFLLASAVQAQTDLLRIEVEADDDGETRAEVSLMPNAGPSFAADILALDACIASGDFPACQDKPLVDVGAVAAGFDFSLETVFEPDDRLRVIFNPVTLSSSDFFIPLISALVDGDLQDPTEVLNRFFESYEIEVDGVAVQGDLLRIGTPELTPPNTCLFLTGSPSCGYFYFYDYSQQLEEPGEHRIVARFNFRADPDGRNPLNADASAFFPNGSGMVVLEYPVIVDDGDDEDSD